MCRILATLLVQGITWRGVEYVAEDYKMVAGHKALGDIRIYPVMRAI
jgi:hypothetical protein